MNGRNALMWKNRFTEPTRKKLNEDRHILSAAKFRAMILISRNIRYMRIFVGVPRGGGVKPQWGCRRAYFSSFVTGCVFGNFRQDIQTIMRYTALQRLFSGPQMRDLE